LGIAFFRASPSILMIALFKRKPFNRRLLVPNLEARTYVDGPGRKIH
jgi:hypothetical protein